MEVGNKQEPEETSLEVNFEHKKEVLRTIDSLKKDPST